MEARGSHWIEEMWGAGVPGLDTGNLMRAFSHRTTGGPTIPPGQELFVSDVGRAEAVMSPYSGQHRRHEVRRASRAGGASPQVGRVGAQPFPRGHGADASPLPATVSDTTVLVGAVTASFEKQQKAPKLSPRGFPVFMPSCRHAVLVPLLPFAPPSECAVAEYNVRRGRPRAARGDGRDARLGSLHAPLEPEEEPERGALNQLGAFGCSAAVHQAYSTALRPGL